MSYWSHETAIVDEGAKIGEGTKVWHWAHICGKNVDIGQKCSFGQNVYVGNDVKIGNGVKVQNNVSIYDAVELEDDVFCGPSMVFTNVVNPRSAIVRKHEFRKTLVRKGASIGANATIVCGHEVGPYAFVAAGAVVTKNIAAYSLVAGVPAKPIGWMCECGERLPVGFGEDKANCSCSHCDRKYKIVDNNCQPA